jgi:hypothetical protein
VSRPFLRDELLELRPTLAMKLVDKTQRTAHWLLKWWQCAYLRARPLLSLA